jgi:divalent metal cation (Fe/Co/Zn/Cd) transporter
MLARARIQTDRLSLGYKGGSLPLPTVLIGGAAVPVLASIARQFGAVKGQGPVLVVPLGVILAIVFAVLAWVLLQGAGLAHRRIKVTLDPSLAALYETIGHCGNPPRDDSAAIAAAAIGLTALAWFGVPIAIAIIATFL